MSSQRRASGPDRPALSPTDVGRTVGRYLLAIHRRSEPEGRRVSTGELRRALGVSAASVTEMVAKLDDRGFVDHERYRGVRLTGDGRSLATTLAWRFCVVDRFFESVLDADLDDGTVYEIGYALPRDGLFRLHELAERPCVEECPEAASEGAGCPT